ncbi:hypothetical protein Tco_1550773 [Tanacetum coccineum]
MDVVEDIFENPTREPRVHVPNVLPIHPTLHLDSDFTLSSDSLGSDVVDFPDCDDSRARGFVLRSLKLQILSFILGIQYPNLID